MAAVIVAAGAVLVLAEVVPALARLADLAERQARLDGAPIRPEVRAVLDELRASARVAQRRAAAELVAATSLAGPCSTPGTPERSDPVSESTLLSARAVAQALGCSTRNVRALATRGSLPGTRGPAGEWLFDPTDVARWMRQRDEDIA
ncbi:MAG: helix-turn-helix domain-containing protein [Motilibacteraceae bacterium]